MICTCDLHGESRAEIADTGSTQGSDRSLRLPCAPPWHHVIVTGASARRRVRAHASARAGVRGEVVGGYLANLPRELLVVG
jgi:hypothetical protein